MKKLFLIGLKDLKLAFRDRAALVLMLLAPFVLTVGLGFVTGRFGGGSSSGLSDIPVVIVNLDKQELGNALVDVFKSEELADLIKPSESDDPEAARRLIDEDKAAAVVIIPEGFSRSIVPAEGTNFTETYQEPALVKIEVYANPARPTSVGVVKAIVDEFISRVEEGRTSGMTSILQMVAAGVLTQDNANEMGRSLVEKMQNAPDTATTAIVLKTEKSTEEATEFDPLAYMAPGMALMFLMYAVTFGGRTILTERQQGTLPRLLVSPTTSTQIMGGKVFGIFMTGVTQMSILILASALLFGVRWGDPLGVAALILAAVFGATGWGLLITAVARTPGQASSIGTAITLTFGILGGTFIMLEQMPPFMQTISKITPNAWALDGFTILALGGSLEDLGLQIAALLAMGIILFAVSVFLFNKNGIMQK